MNIGIQRFTGVNIGGHSNTGVYKSKRVYMAIQGFTGAYMGEHSNTGVYRSIHG